MSTLRPELQEAVERLHSGARVETLPGDASTRQFHRLHLPEGGSRIVMDYGAPFTGETDDVRLARIFERGGLPVARVLDVVGEAGCLILEDLGVTTLEDALSRSGEGGAGSREELYRKAVDLAAEIGSRGTDALSRSERASGPALDEERFLFEMRFFVEHFVGGYLGRPEATLGLTHALEELAKEAATHPRVMCHRDFHSRNLMVRPDGSLAMVDIQDARWGPDTYDIASLLRDAYVDIDEGEVESLFERFLERRGRAGSVGDLHQRFHVAATQRMIKALGTFGYQVSRLGRTRYAEAIPRTQTRLKSTVARRPETLALDASLRQAGVYG